MKMEVNLQQRLEQRMQLSQQMLQNLELLQMPLMALKEKLDQELQENPTLEVVSDVEEPAEAPPATPERSVEEERKSEFMESFDEHWQETERRGFRGGSSEDADKKMEMLQNVGDKPTSLQDHLRHQLGLLEVSDEDRPYIEHIIDNIADTGYLLFPLEEVVESAPAALKEQGFDILKRKLENALLVVQRMDPRGVGARSPRECLLLQLDETEIQYPAKRRLIERHLEDIGANRLPKIVKEVANDPAALSDFGYKPGVDPNIVMDDVKLLISELQKLNPHPGGDFARDVAPRVYPEVLIRQIDGKYEIVIEDSYLPPVTVNRNYLEMLKDKNLSKTEREFIKRKLDAGKKLISAIEQRRSTIQRITAEILKHQMSFFENGIEHLRPLKMQEVADVIGVHVSTVSRAISEKWIETPRGIFPMKFFFASAAPKQDAAPPTMIPGGPSDAAAGEPDEATRLAILEKIREIIDDEEKKNPLSDLQIAKILKQQGIAAARRTIAKYREELNIPSSRLRKQY